MNYFLKTEINKNAIKCYEKKKQINHLKTIRGYSFKYNDFNVVDIG